MVFRHVLNTGGILTQLAIQPLVAADPQTFVEYFDDVMTNPDVEFLFGIRVWHAVVLLQFKIYNCIMKQKI